MATRNTTPASDVLMPGETPLTNGADIGDDELEVSITERVHAVLAENVGDPAQISIWRLPRDGKPEYCETMAPEDFGNQVLDVIRAKWGAGTYEARIYGSRDGKNTGYLRRPRFKIAAVSPLSNYTGNGQQQHQQSDALTAILAQLAQGQQAIVEALRQRPPERDPMEEMQKTISLIGAMREAFQPPAPPPAAPPTDPMTLMKQAFEVVNMAREATQDDAPKSQADSLIAMAGPLIETIGGALKQQQAAGTVAPVGPIGPIAPMRLPPSIVGGDAHPATQSPVMADPPALSGPPDPGMPIEPNPAEVPSGATPATSPTTKDPENMPNPLQALVLRGHADKLLSMIDAGKSPEDGGEYIADEFPEDILPYLSLSTWWEILRTLLPADMQERVSANEQWIRDAVTHANKLLDEADDGGDGAGSA